MRMQFGVGAQALTIVFFVTTFLACGHKSDRGDQYSSYSQSDRSLSRSESMAAPADTSAVAGDAFSSAPSASRNSEEYHAAAERGFASATSQPLSTFSIDVDAASYSNVRRMINEGRMPDPDAVRIEEMINYFTYDYPQPSGDDPFSITTEVAGCPWNHDHRIVQIGIQGRTVEAEDLPPNNLVFLVDVSGSMNEPNKLPLVQASLRGLVSQLRSEDRVAIVVYAGAAGLVLPSTPGDETRTILAAIDRLEAGGSTAGGAGIDLAYRIARENFISDGSNRVILATDGDFNVGPSSEGALVHLIEEKRRSGVFLTVLGFGAGNLKDSRMEQLADKGNGHYAYIDGIDEARKVLGRELGATLLTIAKDVKIQVEFNPQYVREYRLIGYENRALAARDFNDDRKDAGELGAGHTVTALYEIVPANGSAGRPGVDPLRYQPSRTRTFEREFDGNGEMLTVKLRYKKPTEETSNLIVGRVHDRGGEIESASENLRFSSAVAEWGMLLRGSSYRGESSYDDVLARASDAVGDDENGYRNEFLDLVRSTRRYAHTAM